LKHQARGQVRVSLPTEGVRIFYKWRSAKKDRHRRGISTRSEGRCRSHFVIFGRRLEFVPWVYLHILRLFVERLWLNSETFLRKMWLAGMGIRKTLKATDFRGGIEDSVDVGRVYEL
jgi:hypothetical protein